MKKQLSAALAAFALLLTMTGCSAANAIRMLNGAEDRVEAKLDAAEDKLEASLRKEVTPYAPDAVPGQASPVLTGEQARKIALDSLDLTEEQVTGLRVAYEIDDGIPLYDVEFHQGDWEYEFEIHGETGKILSYDKDHKYD